MQTLLAKPKETEYLTVRAWRRTLGSLQKQGPEEL